MGAPFFGSRDNASLPKDKLPATQRVGDRLKPPNESPTKDQDRMSAAQHRPNDQTPNLARYSRQMLFEKIGEQGQRRLHASRVTLIGCGWYARRRWLR